MSPEPARRRRRSRLDIVDHQHSGQFRIRAPQPRFDIGIQASGAIRHKRVLEHRLQRPRGTGFPASMTTGPVTAVNGSRSSTPRRSRRRVERHHPASMSMTVNRKNRGVLEAA